MKRNLIILFVLLAQFVFAQAQKVELIFSHKHHMVDAGTSCTDCHALADSSLKPTDNLLPNMDTCYKCHDANSACTMCHKDPDNAIPYPRVTKYIAHFPHATHVNQKVECIKCHAGVEASENILDKHLPSMALCATCHSDLEKPGYCYDCHGKKETLMPASHALDWRKAHGIVKQTENDCQMCHTEKQCLDCHKKDNLDRRVHPFNFRNNHAIAARANKDNCITCHEENQFCIDCHRTEMVYPRSHQRPNWVNFAKNARGGRHAKEGEMDIESCLSCHNDINAEPICAQCHTKE